MSTEDRFVLTVGARILALSSGVTRGVGRGLLTQVIQGQNMLRMIYTRKTHLGGPESSISSSPSPLVGRMAPSCGQQSPHWSSSRRGRPAAIDLFTQAEFSTVRLLSCPQSSINNLPCRESGSTNII